MHVHVVHCGQQQTLLPSLPAVTALCIQPKPERRLHEHGYILSDFAINKSWDCRTVIVGIKEAFMDKIPEAAMYDFWTIKTMYAFNESI